MNKPSIRRSLAATFLGILVATTVNAAAPASDAQRAKVMKRVVDHAKDKRWTSARDAARSLGDRAAIDAYEWLRLRKPGIDNFGRMAAWVNAHPGWPDQKRIQAQGEKALKVGALRPDQIVAFFDRHPPFTGHGAALYAEALSSVGRPQNAAAAATRAWLELDLTASDEQRMLRRFGATLKPLNDRRLDALIWRTRLTAAKRQLRRASPGPRALGRARIALLKRERNVDGLVKAVPRALKSDPGLAYARMVWRYKKGLRDTAEQMMLEMSRQNRLGDPVKWADERALFVREALDKKRNRRAYDLASVHGLSEGKHFADLEWIAGWIALRKLNDPSAAMVHFSRLHSGVTTPVSKARAAFWAGEAATAAGNAAEAQRWRSEGSLHQSTFYGQLASERLTGNPTLNLPPETAANLGPCHSDPRVAVGSALALGGAIVPARTFFYDVAKTCNGNGELKALAQIAADQGALRISVGLSRKLRKDGIFIPEISHPLVPLPSRGCKGKPAPERALTLAIARQESGFHAEAGSGAGAKGIMQVMPGTARRTVGAAGLRYDVRRLGSDSDYNAIIGQCYISQMLELFNGSYPLAIASYNAGPNRIKQWLKRNGDPRNGEISTIDWIERIPYHETRNYVQRVLEGVAVYRARMR